MNKQRFPLATLLQLREHRVETARALVMERQAQVQARREACTAIEGEIVALNQERASQRLRLLDPPPAGVPWAMAMAQREAHVDHLAELANAARQRLADAQGKLREAEAALDEARKAFFRAKSRLEALEKRRDVWRKEQSAIAQRREEAQSADLLLAARQRSTHHNSPF
ncbi:hypothetical protein RDV84_07930 [Lysobacter yananisis]|uniref:Uncharacterized protein n=3 Tax=Lysobacter TaxID=68 RepID=A0A0S2DPW2_LYSEN|nr:MULTISPECIES: hypothetical protein [Lysobacter]ALN60445.1 hypothetical protein GLE_5104 [Lysobacter enzymogenes]QCW28379.1 hypothetical protein FE772_24735 [Lysobacter enzymogenes]WMT04754.1 hypothetical protein RDV84_07930 [Lysobacter yananisis]